MRQRIRTAEAAQKLLDVVHDSRVILIATTFTSTHNYAKFIDVEFGEWTAIALNVLNGSCHPLRGAQNRRETNLKKYGSTCSLNDSHVRAKAHKTCIDRYGAINPFQSEKIKQQICDDNVAKYGVSNTQQRNDVRQKTIATNLARYGVACTLNDPDTLEKIRKTNLKKYGVENPIQNREVSRRALTTSKLLYVRTHWKTNEELICAGTYELAFVNWCNHLKIDFDWQISFVTPLLTKRGVASKYIIDAFVKDGDHANTWVEIKGRFTNVRNREKWDWFHAQHPIDSQLWTKQVLIDMGILDKKGRPNQSFAS